MSEWTKEEPSIGTWWLSIAPEKRPAASGYPSPAVIKCHVALISPGHLLVVDGIEPTKHVRYEKGGYWRPLEQSWFAGAQWKRADPDPEDPFAEQTKLSPEAERIWKSLSPATEVSGDDARQLLESLSNVAPPEEIARRRAVSRELLSRVGASKTTGLEMIYNVTRVDGKPIKCGCIVLEFDDLRSQPALLVWADSMEAAGHATVAADVRAAVDDANLFHFMPDGTRILKNPHKPSSRDNDLS